jgi:hypothetical protein
MPFTPSAALCPLYVSQSSLWPSVPSTALCPLLDPSPLYGPLYFLWPLLTQVPSAPSTALCPL